MPAVAHNPDVQGVEEYERFLIEKTAGIRHSGRDFIDHLRGTRDILQKRGNPEYVCLAGLFHSIYGTNSFKLASFPLSDRARIQALIGVRAEDLAHRFCTYDRPRAFVDNTHDVSSPVLRDLLEIEWANLTEQGAPTEWVEMRLEFERCWPWLKASIAEGSFVKPDGTIWPTHRKEDVWKRIKEGRCFFWPGRNCALLSEFHNHPSGLKSHHIWAAGGDLKEIQVIEERYLVEHGKEHGCHRQTGWGRRGWLRAFKGYRETGVRKEKSLI